MCVQKIGLNEWRHQHLSPSLPHSVAVVSLHRGAAPWVDPCVPDAARFVPPGEGKKKENNNVWSRSLWKSGSNLCVSLGLTTCFRKWQKFKTTSSYWVKSSSSTVYVDPEMIQQKEHVITAMGPYFIREKKSRLLRSFLRQEDNFHRFRPELSRFAVGSILNAMPHGNHRNQKSVQNLNKVCTSLLLWTEWNKLNIMLLRTECNKGTNQTLCNVFKTDV